VIPQSFLQDLLNRVDIVEVVGRYVKLKQGGANFIGLCPFHNEKSPSFTVSPTKQFYHCFGCGAHGTAIGFLIEYSGIGFVDAVQDLAQQVGMTVPAIDTKLLPAQQAEYQAKSLALSEVMKQADEFYRHQLRNAPHAVQYLKKRGLTGEIAAKFGLGYAPEGWDNLRTVFANYDDSALTESGLIINRTDEDGANRKRYDRFRDRIMFPIRNIKGQVIGFGGRILETGEPKYLNSPETPLFQKGNELYGLFEARLAIRAASYVLVVEGYMDVVALTQWGFPQVVATLGTACTSTQVQKLVRQTDQIIFSFDGDAAGRQAAWRALQASLPHATDNKTIKFLFLPSEHDPDSYVREFGSNAFEQQIRNALPLSQFLINEVTADNDLTTPEGRARSQFNAKPLLQAMSASALRLQIVHNLAQLTRTTAAEIEALFELARPSTKASIAPPKSKRTAPIGLERQIMRLIIANPALAAELDQTAVAAVGHFAPAYAPMWEQLIAISQTAGEQGHFAALAEQLRAISSDFDSLIAEVAIAPESEIKTARLELAGAIRQTKMKLLKIELDQLASSGLETEENRMRYRELMLKQEQLRRQAESSISE